jgi:ornithine--oxo-acid transaminase
MFLPQSSGCESCESAIKVARRWGYVKKNIPENQATIYFAERNFMGRSITVCSGSSDPGRMK